MKAHWTLLAALLLSAPAVAQYTPEQLLEAIRGAEESDQEKFAGRLADMGTEFVRTLESSLARTPDPEIRRRLRQILHDLRLKVNVPADVEDSQLLGRPTVEGRKLVTKVYDTRAMTSRVQNHPFNPSWVGIHYRYSGQGASFSLEEPSAPVFSIDDVVTVIQENIDTEIWEEDLGMVTVTPNRELLVRAPEATQARVAAALRDLGRMGHIQTRCTLWVFRLPHQLAAKRVGDRWELSTEEFERLLGEGDRLVGLYDLSGYSGQSLAAQSGGPKPFRRAYRCEVSCWGGPCHRRCPQMQRFWNGVRIGVVANAAPDRNRLRVNLRLQVTRLLSMDKLEIWDGEIDLPRIDHTSLVTERSVPIGKHVVLGRMGSVNADDGRNTEMVVVGYFRPLTTE